MGRRLKLHARLSVNHNRRHALRDIQRNLLNRPTRGNLGPSRDTTGPIQVNHRLRRRGRAVAAVINGRLYMILFDAARSHYYNALLPDFEAIVSSARLV